MRTKNSRPDRGRRRRSTAGPSHSEFARRHPKLFLATQGIVGLILAVGCTWIFSAIAEDVPEKGAMVRVDFAVTNWLQVHGTEYGESVFSVVSLFGAQILTGMLIVAVLVLLGRRDWRHLILLAVTCGGGVLLNLGLKASYHRARPAFASEFPVTSWSFPSGHAMDSLIGYGLLAYWLSRKVPRFRVWIGVGAAAVIVAIGFSRIYLGVHYLSDVIAGYSAGLLWLVVCISGYRFADAHRLGPSGADER
jgi:membrane-associated phospholipid phosphatase